MTTVDSAIESTKGTGSSRLSDMVQMANGLSAARVFASIFVVLLHSAIPYMVSPVPLWVVHDSHQHVSIDVMVFWINGFVMPMFFLLAGISVSKTSFQTPVRKFVGYRFRRLGSAFLLAGILIVPPLLFCWGIGMLWTERLTMADMVRLSFPEHLNRYFGPLHLWFLEYLLLICVVWSVIARTALRSSVASRIVQGKWALPLFRSVWGPLVLAVPTAVIFIFDADTPFRLVAPFLPDVARTLHYSVFFVAGVWLAGSPQSCTMLRNHHRRHLLMAAVAFAGLGPLTLAWFEKGPGLPGPWALAGLQAIFAWCMVFGFLGLMMGCCNNRNESIRYGNEASFWLYLAHLPVVCAMQLVVWPWQIHPWWKLTIVAAVGVFVTLLAYEYCIRYSLLGVVINGSRKRHARMRGWRLESAWLSVVAAGLLCFAGFLWTGWEPVSGPNLHTVVAGSIYRSNRLKPKELNEVIRDKKIRSVIGLAVGKADEPWFFSLKDVCNQKNIPMATFSFDEHRVPSAMELEILQLELKNSLRPVLLIGGNHSPTLSGFGSAVALLVDEATMEEALGQLGMQYFQLEGAEHCVVARPLREYRDWLDSKKLNHSAGSFSEWTQQAQIAQEKRSVEGNQQPEWQAMIGAPRYPRRY